MAPKSWPPKRFAKTTARKTTVPPVVVSLGTSTSSSTGSRPQSSIATARSALGSSLKADGLLISPDIKHNPKIENSSPSDKCSSAANFSLQPQDKIKKTVTRPRKKIRVGDEVQEHAMFNLGYTGQVLRSCSAQDAISVTPKSAVAGVAEAELEGGDGGGSSTGLETMVIAGTGETGVEVKGKVGDEALSEVDKGANEAGGSTKVGECRTRKVVKKVRIVKKIVKRRVPKRVVTVGEGIRETRGVEIGGHTKGTELGLIEVEKIDSSGAVGNEETESTANVNIFKERDESFEPAMNELNLIEVGAADHIGTFSVETEENSKPNCNVAVEFENEGLKEMQGQAEEITKMNLSAESTVTGEDVLQLRDPTSGSSPQGLVAGENAGNESLMVDDQLENGNVKFVEMKSGNCFEDLSAGLIQEKRQDGEEKNDVGLNGALALSGEMEALERRKRRRTEIFVGGLGKDTQEEDIRKLFELVGELRQVTLVKNRDSGKNKGFAFLRFASAADAKKALEKFSTVEICGKQCGVRPVEGNDTIYLGNINKKWKTKDVVHQLKVAKIQNIDEVIVMANPNILEQNRGFAFLEFQTSRDAQIAFSKLQKYDAFVNQMKIKVAWAQPLVEPDEEEMLKVKKVYAEYLPSSWDEVKAKNFFKRFGEIEGITLSKNLPSSQRKDFAFVNYTTREAALACIETLVHEQVDDAGTKVKVKVSLAKPLAKMKQTKQLSSTSGKEYVKEKQMASKAVLKVHEPLKSEKRNSSNLEGIRVDRKSSPNDELLQILRQQAQVGQPRPGSSDLNYHYASAGIKRPFSANASHSHFLEPRWFPRSYAVTSHSYGSTSRVDMVSLPNYQQQRTSDTHELPSGFGKDPHFKTREQAAYFGRSGMYQGN